MNNKNFRILLCVLSLIKNMDAPGEEITININGLAGTLCTFTASPEDSIYDVKRKAEKTTGVPVEHQQLASSAGILDSNKPLKIGAFVMPGETTLNLNLVIIKPRRVFVSLGSNIVHARTMLDSELEKMTVKDLIEKTKEQNPNLRTSGLIVREGYKKEGKEERRIFEEAPLMAGEIYPDNIYFGLITNPTSFHR